LNALLASSLMPSSPSEPSECTVVVRGVPARYLQVDLIEIWNPREFQFNFLFLPYSKKQHRSVTYCFINFTSCEAALAFQSVWANRTLLVPNKGDGVSNNIPLTISPAQVQGFGPNVLHIGNDPKFTSLRFLPLLFDRFGNEMDFHATLNSLQ